MARPLEREIRDLRAVLFSPRDPEGRGFAPLADALRRAGDLGQALEVVEEGLHRHPDFSTGHVVAGWIHRARGEEEAAERAFRRVLELDDENVSALRGLGFLLAEGDGRWEALEIFRRLDELDPGDLEVRARLLELGAAAAEEGEPAVVDIAELAPDDEGGRVVDIAELAPDDEGGRVVDIRELAPEGGEEAVVGIGELAPEEGDEGVVGIGELAPEVGDEAVVGIAELAPEEEDEGVVGIAELAPEGEAGGAVDVDAPASEPPVVGEPSGVEAAVPFVPAEDAPGGGEQELFDPWGGGAPPEDVVPVEDAEPGGGTVVPSRKVEPGTEAAGESGAGTVGAGLPGEAPSGDEDPAGVVPLVVPGDEEPRQAPGDEDDQGPWTRTMAELYAGQGFPERAARIYRRLARENPGDAELRARLEELEASPEAAPTRGEVSGGLEPGTPEGPPETAEGGADASLEAIAPHWAAGSGSGEEPPGPFAWGGSPVEDEGVREVGGEEPEAAVSEYLRSLLRWRPGGGSGTASGSDGP